MKNLKGSGFKVQGSKVLGLRLRVIRLRKSDFGFRIETN
ncbi:hypothetical protein D1AOALGA4SA_6744 [Olavius algarvensis Delta 1 endosymbiont]|nr:hypothetical protein D1AOALGA4SA_6744 [Olavius algarvensis Delta 1 endosymbiont]